MSGPPPAVAAVRSAVRRVLSELPDGTTALVACSGGADSLALAGAVAFEAPRSGVAAGAVTVDHGLQEGSGERAEAVADVLRKLGLDPVRTAAVRVRGSGGPEAAARRARYGALGEAAAAHAPAVVLLGHTLDDQAETVLLGLARGSGARSLAGMAPRTGRYLRPLLDLDRATVRAACSLMGLSPWEDPHNHDPRFARSRVRHEALPALEKALGPGIAAALARTAGMLRADADTLDSLAADLHGRALAGGKGTDLAVGPLERAEPSLRSRVLHRAALQAGCPASALNARHVRELDRLVTEWRGQAHIDLPGGIRGRRAAGRILFER
ncbi:tRNA(Ile)-lysidine synthase [Nocardiopsis terrae]|uniref:tRNA(Ile)-lysidine synthase n=1 Tax=Nocardiopsis terrae TaxID=372655 RepID=A0ABR9HMR4_9ACTN|nr:tRNA lysidine(34) synthetase TilS [Nocardiopsis terrae]MBE1460329.1 tRNA(Ile)-lysidine synthase [Nocardiopsis terrae]GHC70843.1 tRNA(Ile)-lysidine synthase [Nocardiopsis terrae]